MSEHPLLSLFDGPGGWQVFASGQAEGRLSLAHTPDGSPALRLDYDFRGGGGFVAARRPLSFRLPDTFELTFLLCGEGPANHLEVKVAAPGGADVWRHRVADFAPPSDWTGHSLTERSLPFAWGPAGGGAPSDVEAVELVVAAGPGGSGSLSFARPSFEDQTLRAPAAVLASSHREGSPPDAVLSDDPQAAWRPASDDAEPWWEADFGCSRRFGGLVLRWPEPLPPRAFRLELASDTGDWRCVHQTAAASGPLTHLALPGAEARRLRIAFTRPEGAALGRLTLRPDAFSSTPHDLLHAVAADFPRGWFPRYWLREQSYWTPVGSPEGRRRALINEEGLLEVDEAGFSLEPFVLTSAGPVTWADAAAAPALARSGLPVPAVTWSAPAFTLEIRPWVGGRGDSLTLHAAYRLTRRAPGAELRLAVAVRPFQATPPWQAFRNLGGRSPIQRIRCVVDGLEAEGHRVSATPPPDALGAAAFEAGEAPALLLTGEVPPDCTVEDPAGLASAEMLWRVPDEAAVFEVTLSVPFFKASLPPSGSPRTAALAAWRRRLGAVSWRVPSCAAPAFDGFRTAAGHILINRDGPAIQPGPRRYTRSWVRDCVIMGTALAKAGLPRPLMIFLDWYAGFQRADGFIPCVVDRDGVDGLVEHDSHGQFIWGVREVLRSGGSRAFLARQMPRVRAAADYLLALRATRLTPAFRSGSRAACYGLLPESASHEGYLAHPVHAYWDDFWGVRGLEAAAELADAAGRPGDAARWRAEASRFLADVLRSLGAVIAEKRLDYIPGSVEWADFDPVATANAVALLDLADALPQAPLHAMLDTYLDGVRRKHSGEMPWTNYTAYEIRLIGAFARLGRRADANELLDVFLADRRPREWNQWPEITWRNPRAPGHLGDVPHTWIAAEYLLALASLAASEREAPPSLILASGLPWRWIAEEQGFAVRNLPTRFGPLAFSLRAASESALRVTVEDTLAMPAGGLTLTPPLPPGRRIAAILPTPAAPGALAPDGASVTVSRLPFSAELVLA